MDCPFKASPRKNVSNQEFLVSRRITFYPKLHKILLSIFQQNVIKEAIYQIRTYFHLPKVINNNAWSSAWIINGVGAAIQDIERQDQKKMRRKEVCVIEIPSPTIFSEKHFWMTSTNSMFFVSKN